ncbi:hypothetical protein N5E86_15860 [Stutzerimonas stutzeri]|uniref:hypothetical protein n=1 Tax=Stutzerimonas stutzeri TaxID=316 RepID=UPI00244AA77C|nr:hypothetical protein [Stutzerimonas stutzeri]MDH1555929.1 hypothetical protein [Stutzerimonas stutzeri]
MAVQIPSKAPTYRLGIDVETHCANALVRRLAQLKTTFNISNAGAYREDPGYTQVWVDTRMTEEKLEDWLYRAKGINYVGVWQRREDQIAA